MSSSVFRICRKLFPINKIAIDSTPAHTKQLFLIRPVSSIPPSSPVTHSSELKEPTSSNPDSYAVSYLINSCGLSPETAISASAKAKFEAPGRPDSVLNLLRTHGFSKTQISKLVRVRPEVLLANPEKILLPKIKFLQSIGMSRTDLAKFLSSDPSLLKRSLENHIIPCYNYLKSVVQSDEKVVSAIKRSSWVFANDHKKNLVPNIAVLREFEVPDSHITLLLTHNPVAFLQKHDRFKEIVNEVKEMGFDPFKSTFVLAVHALSGKGSKAIWDRCYEVYRKWGWCEEDILSAFQKHPQCMIMSEKKITGAMDYFVNKMGRNSKDIARHPQVLFYSLEKRIIPRCLVIQVLSLKGLVKKDLSLGGILVRPEKYFLERFVTKYEEEVPQLLSLYQGKLGIHELLLLG